MSRKDSLAWIGLHCLIWGVYLLTLLMDPSCGNAGLDFILTLAATSLLVSLVLLIKRRALREEDVGMSRKDSLAWIGLHCLIWGVYLLTLLMDPSCGNAGLDFILTLAATSLLVSLVLLIKRRTLREEEISFHLSARDEFMRVHEDVGAGRSASDAIL